MTLCFEHHNFIHDIRKTRSKENFVACIKAGQINGVGGRPKTPKENKVIELYKEGHSYREIKRLTGVALATIRRVVVDNNLPSRS